MKNLLITGALGHIGSRFIHGLKPREFNSICMIDNLSTQRYASLFNLPCGVKFKFIEEDICSADLDRYFKGMDTIIHLAAITDATTSFDKRQEVERVNFFGTQKVAQACIRNNCKLIFPSTTSVYGVQSDTVDENCPLTDLKPQSPYAESKLKAEKFLESLGEQEKLKFITFRLGTIFGTSVGMRLHTAINKFCWQAVMQQPITVWRTALKQARPYLDIRDAVEAIKFVIKKNLFDCRIYNVLTTNSTVSNIVEIIKTHIPDLTIEYVDTEIMNQLSYHVSNRRVRSLGFKFNGSLEKGIGETIQLLRAANYRLLRE